MSVLYKDNSGRTRVMDDDYEPIMPRDYPRCSYCENIIHNGEYFWEDDGDIYCEDCVEHFLNATRHTMDYTTFYM